MRGEKKGEAEEGRKERGQFCAGKSPKCRGRKSQMDDFVAKIPPATGQADVLTEASRQVALGFINILTLSNTYTKQVTEIRPKPSSVFLKLINASNTYF